MNLTVSALVHWQADQKLGRQVRSQCFDCAETRADGGAYCARHSGCCLNCSSEDVDVRDEREYDDGVGGWYCAACVEKETDWRIAAIAHELGRPIAEVRELRHDVALQIRAARRAS